MSWQVYIVYRADGFDPFYVGITQNLDRRIREHRRNRGSAIRESLKEAREEGIEIRFLAVATYETKDQARQLEDALIGMLPRTFNRTFPVVTPKCRICGEAHWATVCPNFAKVSRGSAGADAPRTARSGTLAKSVDVTVKNPEAGIASGPRESNSVPGRPRSSVTDRGAAAAGLQPASAPRLNTQPRSGKKSRGIPRQTETEITSATKFDRVAYQREYMRKRRAAQRAKVPQGT